MLASNRISTVVTAPVLYNSGCNVIEFMVAMQNHNLSYYGLLDDLREIGLTAVAKHFGHDADSIRTRLGQHAFASQWRHEST